MSFDINDNSGRKIGSVDKDPEIFSGPDSYTVRDNLGRTKGYITRQFDSSGIFIGTILLILGVLLIPFVLVYRKQKSALILLPAIAVLTAITFKAGSGWIALSAYALCLAFRILLIYSVIPSSLSTVIKTFIGWAIVESLLVLPFWHFHLSSFFVFIASFICILIMTYVIGQFLNLKIVNNPKIATLFFAIITTSISMLCAFLQQFTYYSKGYYIYDLSSLSVWVNTAATYEYQLIFNIIALLISLPLLYLLPSIKKVIKDW